MRCNRSLSDYLKFADRQISHRDELFAEAAGEIWIRRANQFPATKSDVSYVDARKAVKLLLKGEAKAVRSYFRAVRRPRAREKSVFENPCY